jgi:hypothetical protein
MWRYIKATGVTIIVIAGILLALSVLFAGRMRDIVDEYDNYWPGVRHAILTAFAALSSDRVFQMMDTTEKEAEVDTLVAFMMASVLPSVPETYHNLMRLDVSNLVIDIKKEFI